MNSFFASVLSRKRALCVYIPLIFLYAASYFQRTAIPGTIFNELSSDYHLSAVQIAGMSAAFIWVYSLSQLAVGMFADKFSGCRVVAWGGLLFSVGVLIFPFLCGYLPGMYLARTLTGLGASTLYLSLVKETDRLFGRANYSVLIGIVCFVGYCGGLFGTLPYEMLAAHYHWNSVLIWVGVISAGLYLIFLAGKRMVPAAKISSAKISFRPLLMFAKNPYTWLLLFCSTINFGMYFTIQTVFGKKFLQDFAGMSSRGASAVIFSLTFVCMVTLLGSGILTRACHNRRKPQILLSVIVVFLTTLMMFCAVRFKLPAAFFAVGYMLYAFASGFSVAFFMTYQEVNSRDTMAQAAGVINMCNYMAIAVSALLIGKLMDCLVSAEDFAKGTTAVYPQEAYQLIFALMLIPAFISLVLAFFIPETGGHYLHQKMFPQK